MLPTPPSSPPKASSHLAPPLPMTSAPLPAEPPGPPCARAGIGVSQASPSHPGTLRRELGDTELAAYYASKADGAGDLYAHINIVASSPDAVALVRLRAVWALTLLAHPLLAARVDVRGGAVDFVYTKPESVQSALAAADARLSRFSRTEGPDDLLDAYVNERRVLAGDALSHISLRVGTMRDADLSGAGVPSPQQGSAEMLLSVAAFVADTSALHRIMDEVLSLLAVPWATLDGMLATAIAEAVPVLLPPPLEERLGLGRLQAAIGAVAAQRAERPGQVFPRARGQTPRFTVIPTRIYSLEQSWRAAKRCSRRGVDLESVVLALCAVAWTRQARDRRVPINIALSTDLRPSLPYCAGSFVSSASAARTISLPSLAPLPLPDMVWLRASAIHARLNRAHRTTCLSAARVRGASNLAARRGFAASRDAEAVVASANPGLGLGLVLPARAAPVPVGARDPDALAPPRLVGKPLLSVQVGEVEAAYRPERWAVGVESVLVGARQDGGEVALQAYFFHGKLCLSLAYDVNGFVWGSVEQWWGDVLTLVNDVLVR